MEDDVEGGEGEGEDEGGLVTLSTNQAIGGSSRWWYWSVVPCLEFASSARAGQRCRASALGEFPGMSLRSWVVFGWRRGSAGAIAARGVGCAWWGAGGVGDERTR